MVRIGGSLETAPIGEQLFARDASRRDCMAFWLLLDTYATGLLAQALGGRSSGFHALQPCSGGPGIGASLPSS
jgi:hypothetical protein